MSYRPLHPRLREALVVLGASLALFAAITVYVWLEPSRMDERAILGLAELRTTEGVAFAQLATRLGDRWTTVVLTVTAVIALLAYRRRRAAAFLTAAVAGAGALNVFAKWVIGRPRPIVVEPVYQAAGLSFPSGHSMASFALFVGIWLVARHESLPTEQTRASLLLAAVVVPIVGFTRAYLGVHYPSDVVAGWALAGAWLAFVNAWYVRHAPWNPPAPDEPDDRQPPESLLG